MSNFSWMVVGQAAQGLILVAIGYLSRHLKKLAKSTEARMKMGTRSGNEV